jgi:hypothetical protein
VNSDLESIDHDLGRLVVCSSMQRSKFAAKRETGEASLFSFGIEKVGVDGRVPIPETHSKGEREGRHSLGAVRAAAGI